MKILFVENHAMFAARLCHLSLSLSFFFSSRRRHTRFDCDWSSDVCSSDLYWPAPAGGGAETLSRSFSSGCPCWPARLSASPLEASASLSSPRAAAGDRHALRLNSARQRRLCNERQLTSGGRHGESWTEWWTGREKGCNESHGGATSWDPCKGARP